MYIKVNDNGEISPLMIQDAAKAVLRGKIMVVASLKNKTMSKKITWFAKSAKAAGGLSCTWAKLQYNKIQSLVMTEDEDKVLNANCKRIKWGN